MAHSRATRGRLSRWPAAGDVERYRARGDRPRGSGILLEGVFGWSRERPVTAAFAAGVTSEA
jgi:hypothetical protein